MKSVIYNEIWRLSRWTRASSARIWISSKQLLDYSTPNASTGKRDMQYKSIIPNQDTNNDKDAETKRKKSLICYNELMSLIVAPVLVIAHWRGIWDMMDLLKEFFPLGPTLALGYVGLFSLDFLHEFHLRKYFQVNDDDSTMKVLSKNVATNFYDYFYNVCTIMVWRTLWEVISGAEGTFGYFNYGLTTSSINRKNCILTHKSISLKITNLNN